MGFDNISNEESLLIAALDKAESINKVTDPSTNPIEVWLTPNGELTIQVPNVSNELSGTMEVQASIDEDKKIEECNYCRQMNIFIKDFQTNGWRCSTCGQEQKMSNNSLVNMVPPFVRNLPYHGNKEAKSQFWKMLTAQEKGIIFNKRNNKKRVQKLIENIEKQRDIEETADMLEING